MAGVVPKAPQALRRRHEPSEAAADEVEKIVEIGRQVMDEMEEGEFEMEIRVKFVEVCLCQPTVVSLSLAAVDGD